MNARYLPKILFKSKSKMFNNDFERKFIPNHFGMSILYMKIEESWGSTHCICYVHSLLNIKFVTSNKLKIDQIHLYINHYNNISKQLWIPLVSEYAHLLQTPITTVPDCLPLIKHSSDSYHMQSLLSLCRKWQFTYRQYTLQ